MKARSAQIKRHAADVAKIFRSRLKPKNAPLPFFERKSDLNLKRFQILPTPYIFPIALISSFVFPSSVLSSPQSKPKQNPNPSSLLFQVNFRLFRSVFAAFLFRCLFACVFFPDLLRFFLVSDCVGALVVARLKKMKGGKSRAESKRSSDSK